MDIAFTIMLLFMIAGVATLVAIIVPFRPFRSRKQAALAHLGAWFGVFVAAGIGASMDPKFQAQMEQDRKQREIQNAHLAVKASQDATQAQASKMDKLQADAKQTWDSVLTVLKPCDAASKDVANGFARSSNPYALYPIVSSAKEVCNRASVELGKIKPPASSEGDAKVEFEKAISACRDGYSVRSVAFDQVLSVLDGDNKPSDVQRAVEAVETASQAPMYCVASYVTAMGKAGISNETTLKLLGGK